MSFISSIRAAYQHRFVMELLQWHKVCEVGGEELHRPPVVALNATTKCCCYDSSVLQGQKLFSV